MMKHEYIYLCSVALAACVVGSTARRCVGRVCERRISSLCECFMCHVLFTRAVVVDCFLFFSVACPKGSRNRLFLFFPVNKREKKRNKMLAMVNVLLNV